MNILTATKKSAFREGNRGETEDTAEPYLARGHDGDGARQVMALVPFLPAGVSLSCHLRPHQSLSALRMISWPPLWVRALARKATSYARAPTPSKDSPPLRIDLDGRCNLPPGP